MEEQRKPQFPPQTQPQQPGKEYVMCPLPLAINPDYKPSEKLNGKVALVTGGDSGIGRSVCYHFALEGATVAFTYVQGIEDRDKDDTLKMLLKAKSSDAEDPIAIATDVSSEEDCKRVVEQVASKYGRIDILVNNAGVQHYTNLVEEITEEWLVRLFRTNIFGYFFMTKHSLKHMKEGSSIINTTSVTAYAGSPHQLLDYLSTKGSIVSFTRGLALRLVDKGIRVNGVAPGPIWTPLQPASLPAYEVEYLGSDVPMGRAGQPYEMAPSYVFLASNQCSSYMTGQVLHPNGMKALFSGLYSDGNQWGTVSAAEQPGKEPVMHPIPQATSPPTSYIGCGATVAFTYVEGVEKKDKDDTLQMLREAKAIDAKDPIAIAADLGFDENCQEGC
ncbi:hypothetical protein NC653_021367 [Populus alba x Populus x berolinensis]|uniref:Uncharacterized protein n=1 Tax=Populus alba x Populus x berolinensis TaxID=444605 RepID=A0AAD6MMS5_9ROSI|nr:hypothetical protein NC653_021367 [Populus alba x Populus x berolinensis]